MLDAAIVMLASVKAHARAERPVTVHALTDFVSPDLALLADQMADEAFTLKPIACTNVHGAFPIRDHITAGTYLRFLLPELLPDVDRIIYLDVDVVVHRDLEALYDVALEGTPMAAMPDWPMLVGSLTWPTFFIPYAGERLRFAAYVERVLGLPCEGTTNYFNCGVMVFDLARWRADDVAGRTVKLLTDDPRLYYMDQDALNVVMGGRYARLDARYNAFANCSFPAYVNALVRFTRAGERQAAQAKQGAGGVARGGGGGGFLTGLPDVDQESRPRLLHQRRNGTPLQRQRKRVSHGPRAAASASPCWARFVASRDLRRQRGSAGSVSP